VGGGTPPRAGEITLAHRGVLFLDELGEFPRDALEALRQPLEDGSVTIVRARHSVELPSRFMLAAATNPCPCGKGPESGQCGCMPAAVLRYQRRISGALADRIDAIVTVARPTAGEMSSPRGEGSKAVRERVMVARERQNRRLGPGRTNAETSGAEIREVGRISDNARECLERSYAKLGMSGRGYDRVLRLSRTIADLAGAERVTAEYVEEALSFRGRAPAGVGS
jgi:magnesium chelatase family protein